VQGPSSLLLKPGQPVGLLGIEFHTRRRNRANGLIAAVDSQGLRIAVQQSFGNCPKYIQLRELHHVPAGTAPTAPAVSFSGLDAEARKQISAADTFFVATSSGAIDISHRGGPQGFVDIYGNTLTIPDFRGNRYFNTLGNILLEPRAALLFVDFSSGDLLHLQGRAEILWAAGDRFDSANAERRWRFHTAGGWRQHGALPLRQAG
jgi:predicted pyridoxine 5'-phosphate oxidase superfamily flavin-nucleotide-binding protein